eukprot:860215-Amphidinium_carterae.1
MSTGALLRMMRVLSCRKKPSDGVGENVGHTPWQDLLSQDHVLLQLLQTNWKVEKNIRGRETPQLCVDKINGVLNSVFGRGGQ